MTKVRRTSTSMTPRGKPRHTVSFALCRPQTVLLSGWLQAVSDTPEGLPRQDEEQGSGCATSCKPAQQGRQSARGRSQSSHAGSSLIQSGKPIQTPRWHSPSTAHCCSASIHALQGRKCPPKPLRLGVCRHLHTPKAAVQLAVVFMLYSLCYTPVTSEAVAKQNRLMKDESTASL